ncbi:hypothetical protein DEV91_1409 [Phyllobacterium brassicacearum]|nr:hypothetical protein DEV91_1409 [Phyllobacterium brassicacearum]
MRFSEHTENFKSWVTACRHSQNDVSRRGLRDIVSAALFLNWPPPKAVLEYKGPSGRLKPQRRSATASIAEDTGSTV